MLNSIRLTDFKNHADTTVRLGELTLLVGPNGAGKTGILQGIHLVSQVLQGKVASALARPGGWEVLVRRGADRFAIDLAGKDPRDSQRAWEIRITGELKSPMKLTGGRVPSERRRICAWTPQGYRNPATRSPRTRASISTGMGWRPPLPT